MLEAGSPGLKSGLTVSVARPSTAHVTWLSLSSLRYPGASVQWFWSCVSHLEGLAEGWPSLEAGAYDLAFNQFPGDPAAIGPVRTAF